VPICGLILEKQFPLFFAKIDKIAYTCNIVKMLNIQIGITSFVYCVQDIDTFFACIVGCSRSANSNTLSKISREPRELPWQPNLGKNKPKLHRLHFCARNRGLFALIVRFSGSANSNMLSKISREPRELPWQPNLGNKSLNCT